ILPTAPPEYMEA
nr:Chain B, 12-mer from Matrix protein VP40 [HTLV-1 isolate Mel 15]